MLVDSDHDGLLTLRDWRAALETQTVVVPFIEGETQDSGSGGGGPISTAAAKTREQSLSEPIEQLVIEELCPTLQKHQISTGASKADSAVWLSDEALRGRFKVKGRALKNKALLPVWDSATTGARVHTFIYMCDVFYCVASVYSL